MQSQQATQLRGWMKINFVFLLFMVFTFLQSNGFQGASGIDKTRKELHYPRYFLRNREGEMPVAFVNCLVK